MTPKNKPWLYSQSTGYLWDPYGELVGKGYSGFGDGKNNPDCESTRDIGPIPKGLWRIGRTYDSDNVGKHAIVLTPVDHNAFDRTDFRCHGDSAARPGKASNGCMVQQKPVRQKISMWTGGLLLVVE